MTVSASEALDYASNAAVLKLVAGLLVAWTLLATGAFLFVEPYTLPSLAARFLGAALGVAGLVVGYHVGVALLYKATADAMLDAAVEANT